MAEQGLKCKSSHFVPYNISPKPECRELKHRYTQSEDACNSKFLRDQPKMFTLCKLTSHKKISAKPTLLLSKFTKENCGIILYLKGWRRVPLTRLQAPYSRGGPLHVINMRFMGRDGGSTIVNLLTSSCQETRMGDEGEEARLASWTLVPVQSGWTYWLCDDAHHLSSIF